MPDWISAYGAHVKYRRYKFFPGTAALLLLAATTSRADPVLSSGYNLNMVDLGTVSLPLTTSSNTFQGLDFNGQSLLLAAWNPAQANYPTSEELWQIPVTYSAGQISLAASASAYATVSTNYDNVPFSFVVSGGLITNPDGTLYYTTSEGDIGWYHDGASAVSTTLPDPSDPQSCAQTWSCSYVTAIGYLPVGKSTQLVAAFSDGNWYQVSLATDAGSNTIAATLGNLVYSGLEATSFVYFPGSFAGFSTGGILVGDAASQTLKLYGLDSNGNLIPNSQPVVVYTTGNGLVPGYGVARDPNTGDFLFTTYDNNNGYGQIYELTVETPEPSAAVMLAACIVLLWWRRTLFG